MDISDLRADPCHLDHESLGDTWDPTWAADGSLYTPGNDGSGWRNGCSANVFCNRVQGEDPRALRGETVNGMADFGGWGHKGADGCTWKSSGCLMLEGTLYLALARHCYGSDSGDPLHRQTAARASIIASRDGGRTWNRSGQDCYDTPLFAEGRFATPYFIHYGQDGAAPARHGAERYVYAISNNGFWCNGDDYILGRVPRERLAALRRDDWQFFCGGDGDSAAAWSGELAQATPIIRDPGRCGETGATWIPELERYVLVAWHYPGDPSVETDETRFIFHQAPTPWGPWTRFGELTNRPEGWYCPRILAKWQRRSGDEVEVMLVTGGDYYEMGKFYRFVLMPLRLRAGGNFPPLPLPPPVLNFGHAASPNATARNDYSGDWQVLANRIRAADFAEHASEQAGAAFSVRFQGRGLRWFASKENCHGIASVSLDGGPEVEIDQYTYCRWPQCARLLWASGALPPGEHLFTVRVSGRKGNNSTGIRICHDRVEILP